MGNEVVKRMKSKQERTGNTKGTLDFGENRNPLVEGIFPTLMYYCDCLVMPLRSNEHKNGKGCISKGELSGDLLYSQPWPKVDSFKQCQEICQFYNLCKGVSYEAKRHFCWLYSKMHAVYPSEKLQSGPKSCQPHEKFFYSMEDFSDIWTGTTIKTAMIDTMKAKYLKPAKLGIQCFQIDIPKRCKELGGYSFTIGYSSDGTCQFAESNSIGIDGTCQDFENNPQNTCGFCNIKNSLGEHRGSVFIEPPQECSITCINDGLMVEAPFCNCEF